MKTSNFLPLCLFLFFISSLQISAQNSIPNALNANSYKNEISHGVKLGSGQNPLEIYTEYGRQIKGNFIVRAGLASNGFGYLQSDLTSHRWYFGLEKQHYLTDKLQAFAGITLGQSYTALQSPDLFHYSTKKYEDQFSLNFGLKYQVNNRLILKAEYAYFRSYLTKREDHPEPTNFIPRKTISRFHQFSFGAGYKF